MLGLLVRNENFEVIKIAFAVVAPRASQKLLEGGAALLFPHCDAEELPKYASFRSPRPMRMYDTRMNSQESATNDGHVSG